MSTSQIPSCDRAFVARETLPDGRMFESYGIDAVTLFRVEVERPSLTPPAQVVANEGYCSLEPVPPMLTTASMAPPVVGGGGLVLLSCLGAIVGMVGAGVALSYALKPDPSLLPPMRQPALLPPPPQGNQSHGIPSVEPMESGWNSHEFERNSQGGENANSLGIPQVSADSQDWPPKGMEAAYDATQPEQPGEFESFRRALEADGLNPRGNDIIKRLWGVTPGRSTAYQAARDRRDQFAKRLEYYRYEEM